MLRQVQLQNLYALRYSLLPGVSVPFVINPPLHHGSRTGHVPLYNALDIWTLIAWQHFKYSTR